MRESAAICVIRQRRARGIGAGGGQQGGARRGPDPVPNGKIKTVAAAKSPKPLTIREFCGNMYMLENTLLSRVGFGPLFIIVRGGKRARAKAADHADRRPSVRGPGRGKDVKKDKIVDLVKQELSGFLEENGMELYHAEFKKEGAEWYLNVYIDVTEDRYVSTDDCEKVSEYLSARLDELDPIEQNYVLQVSSPGLDRELYEQKDFDRFAGELVDLRLYRPVDGSKDYTGTLVGLANGQITIKDEEGNELSFDKKDVAKTKLAVVF